MSVHAVRSEATQAPTMRVNARPSCPLCGAELIAATTSILIDNSSVRSLWSCDECGCGFTTERTITITCQ